MKITKKKAARLFVLLAVVLTLGLVMAVPLSASAAELPSIPSVVMAGGAATGSADSSFSQVITFFVTWIGRIGGVIAFVGAIMFALSIKNNDADAKQQALLTMIAGFVAVAVTGISSVFNMF